MTPDGGQWMQRTMRWAAACATLVLVGCGERTIAVPVDAAADAVVGSADVGCADGEREGFESLRRFPDIAACSGAWGVPGVRGDSTLPACAREGGDDGPRVDGAGCAVADLCERGWSVCATSDEVATRLPAGTSCQDAVAMGASPSFYVTRQSGSGFARCEADGVNDLFGCGNIEAGPATGCEPLSWFSGGRCRGLPDSWRCGMSAEDESREAALVVKLGPAGGGVLCCRD